MEDAKTFKVHFTLTEDKTDKTRKVNLNPSIVAALTEYRLSLGEKFKLDEYIFKSRKGDKAINVKALHKIIKDTCKALNIKGNYGTHTLRKTGAFRIYADNITENPMIIVYLQEILNHSSQKTTLRYIGIEAEKITDIFMNLKHY
ncbi:tyrosine-type recombinase/integrase [Psychrobacillus sp. FSL H8-0487]|uniref:tyrosine-type recombinase/integrase n=1 Tax=Psychrobacillus sp. FSL H8-0487 TaxID=2921391 RepID=UPI0030F9FF7B